MLSIRWLINNSNTSLDTSSCSISTTFGQRYTFHNLEFAFILGYQSTYRLHVHFGTLKFAKSAVKDKLKFMTPVLLVQKDKFVLGCPRGNFLWKWKTYNYSLTSMHSYRGCQRTLRNNLITVVQLLVIIAASVYKHNARYPFQKMQVE